MRGCIAPQGLGWKARTPKELALMEDLFRCCTNSHRGGRFQGLARMSDDTRERPIGMSQDFKGVLQRIQQGTSKGICQGQFRSD